MPESRWPRIAKPWPIRSLTRKCSAAEVPLKIRSSGRYCYTKTWSTPTLCDFTIFSVMVSRRHSFYYYYLFSHECMGNWAYAAHASHNLIHEASDEVSETKVCKIKCDIHLLTKGVGLMSFVKEAVIVLGLMGSFKMTIGPSLLFLRIYPSRSNVGSHIFFFLSCFFDLKILIKFLEGFDILVLIIWKNYCALQNHVPRNNNLCICICE